MDSLQPRGEEGNVFCTNCGASNSAAAGSCFNCGTRLIVTPQAGGLPEEVELKPLINIDASDIGWYYKETLDVTTGAPQKFYRYIRDAVLMKGYNILAEEAPEIIGTAIEKTGTTKGYIVAEKLLRKISNPWKGIGKAAALAGMIILLLYGLYVALSSSLGGGFVFMAVVGAIGSALIAYLNSLPDFESNVVVARLKGEVYYSALGTDVSGGPMGAESRRTSLTSDLRLELELTTILSTNVDAARKVVQWTNTPEAREDFNGILADIHTHTLPKVVLQKSVEQAELYRGQPSARPLPQAPQAQFRPTCPKCAKQVSSEFVICPFCGQRLRSPDTGKRENVFCTKCGASNPSTVKACFNCGAELPES